MFLACFQYSLACPHLPSDVSLIEASIYFNFALQYLAVSKMPSIQIAQLHRSVFQVVGVSRVCLKIKNRELRMRNLELSRNCKLRKSLAGGLKRLISMSPLFKGKEVDVSHWKEGEILLVGRP